MTTRTIRRRLGSAVAAIIIMSALLLALGVAKFTGDAAAQQKTLKEQLAGTWLMATNITIRPDGSKTDTYGPNAQGIAIFDSSDRFTLVTTRSDLPRFASNNRATGTANENSAVVQGSLAYFGTYSVNETEKSYTVQIEASIFPNWVGTAQKRMIAISEDEFTITNPAGSGGGSIESKYKRAK
jgi:lipocalin-like protein